MNFEETLNSRAAEAEQIIRNYLPEETGHQKTLLSAMNYSVLAGGKRLRPILMQEAFRMAGGSSSVIEPFMAAIEMIHTYSLIHDDLPAMDNDDLRRGRKTNHVVYGEAMAILAGDGLLNDAFETAARAFRITPADRKTERAMQVLARKAGIYGMVGGQSADVEAEKKSLEITREMLLFIHENKTAALIQASLMIGVILAGAEEETIQKMEKCGYDIGIAFQIRDDILDVEGSEAVLGKPIGSDERNEKATYVSLYGLEKARQDVKMLSDEAISILKETGGDPFLLQLTEWLITREK